MSDHASVEITAEYIEKLLVADLATYQIRDERAAMRAALGDASALCDMMARAVVDQNKRRGRTTKATRAMSASFTRCANEIWRMRERISVPKSEIPATAPGNPGQQIKDNSV